MVLCRYWRSRRISKVHDTQYHSGPTRHRSCSSFQSDLALVLMDRHPQVETIIFFSNLSTFATSYNSMRKRFPFVVLKQHHESEFQEVSQVTLLFSIWCSFKLCGTHLPSLMVCSIARKRLLIVSCDTCNASANGRWFWII